MRLRQELLIATLCSTRFNVEETAWGLSFEVGLAWYTLVESQFNVFVGLS